MRKKSHISLAKYIVDSLGEQELSDHKKAFYIGSVLPDCRPSFLTVKHEMEGTFPKLRQDLGQLVDQMEHEQINERVFYRNLGEFIHYIADYFTFPHNAHYTGNLKEHCVYEKHLKKELKEYILSGEAEKSCEDAQEAVRELDSADAICEFVRKAHDAYVKVKSSVEADCRYIVGLCFQVVEAVLSLVHGRAPQAAVSCG